MQTFVGLHIMCVKRAVDVDGKESQVVVSRSDSDKCVTRLVGELTCYWKNSPDRGLRSSPHLDPDLG